MELFWFRFLVGLVGGCLEFFISPAEGSCVFFRVLYLSLGENYRGGGKGK